MGAADPTSGTASLAETLRGLGALLKEGWKPLRTIVIASWDAEEVSPFLWLHYQADHHPVWSNWEHRMG